MPEPDERVWSLASQISAFAQLGGRSNTLIVPADATSVPSVIAQAMSAAGVAKARDAALQHDA